MRGESSKMDLIDVGLFERDVGRSITVPVKMIVDDDGFRYNVTVVPRVERFVEFERTGVVRQKKVIGISEFSRQCLRIRVDQKLVFIKPHTIGRVERSANLVAVQLPRLQSFDEGVPHALRPRFEFDDLCRLAIFFVEQQ